MRYKPTRGPEFVSPEMRRTVEWLNGELSRIQGALDTMHDHESVVSRTMPNGTRLKDREGMLRYVSEAGIDPVWAQQGFNYFDGGQWQGLATRQDVIDLYAWVIANFSVPGYGGLRISTPTVVPDIGTPMVKITAFDAVQFTTPDAVVQDLVNSTLAIQEEGVWVISLFLNMLHDDSNQGRLFDLQLYNETDTAAAREWVLSIPRNSGATTFGLSIPFDVPDTLEGKALALYIGNARRLTGASEPITDITANSMVYTLHHVSDYKGAVIPA